MMKQAQVLEQVLE